MIISLLPLERCSPEVLSVVGGLKHNNDTSLVDDFTLSGAEAAVAPSYPVCPAPAPVGTRRVTEPRIAKKVDPNLVAKRVHDSKTTYTYGGGGRDARQNCQGK